jgi:hypothetical protein
MEFGVDSLMVYVLEWLEAMMVDDVPWAPHLSLT